MLAGDFDQWLGLVPDIEEMAIACIADAWPRVRQGIDGNSKENHISRTLTYWLRKDRAATKIGAVGCLCKTEDLDLGENQKVFISGETDLRFQLGSDPDHDLIFECKRLRVAYPHGFKDQADKYVSHGLARFSTGQYASGTSLAGMIGYVMDGNASAAAVDVRNQIASQSTGVGLVSGSLIQLPVVSSHIRLSSSHEREGKSDIEVRHTFLPV